MFPLLIAFLSSPPAFSSTYCEPSQVLKDEVYDCAQNSRYSNAAKTCLWKFNNMIELSTKRLQQELARESKALIEKNAQESALVVTSKSLSQARRNLQRNLEIGRQIQNELLTYRREMRWPMHWPGDQPHADADDPEITALLEAEDECYAIPSHALRDAERTLEEMQENLRTTLARTNRDKSVADHRDARFENSRSQTLIRAPASRNGSPRSFSRRKHQERKSDITGRIEPKGDLK